MNKRIFLFLLVSLFYTLVHAEDTLEYVVQGGISISVPSNWNVSDSKQRRNALNRAGTALKSSELEILVPINEVSLPFQAEYIKGRERHSVTVGLGPPELTQEEVEGFGENELSNLGEFYRNRLSKVVQLMNAKELEVINLDKLKLDEKAAIVVDSKFIMADGRVNNRRTYYFYTKILTAVVAETVISDEFVEDHFKLSSIIKSFHIK